ncbi:molybdopterin molybdenumtransferase MoeA [Halorhabdus sp. CBA1104]|uniref:molybdopterin molybdotransferase MoeA n=1 Tax=unclassified Halorhabdus TaxID=2621901 RepID=UPI0012B3206A|nr:MULTISPECIES: gephyrin-like molybdotransferase Glp [unclassified Halorhabdus]QGN07948.1 molybdopterin molybdenumtransferase MoeA [Halorhabdus sp. CBA1104]
MADRHRAGFQSVTRLADARRQWLDLIAPHDRIDSVPPDEAAGRVLAASVDAHRPVPHFERAAMDGYAVRATDTTGAGARSPRRLQPASGSISAGDAVRVHTGQPIPEGGDAVVMIEHVTQRADELAVESAAAPGENVSPVGEDIPAGKTLFDAGHRLGPADIALLKATGVTEIPVRDPPTVGVVPTGEELVAADPDPGEVVETNGTMVAGLVEQWGGQATKAEIVTDDVDRLSDAIVRRTDRDLLVTTGGSSVGDRDLLPEVIESVGELVVHGVAIKPGHPLGFGTVDETPVLILPGYPVSCYVGALQLLRPSLAHAVGRTPPSIHTFAAELDGKIASEPGVRTFGRVRQSEDNPDRVEPIRVAGASVLSSVTAADGWVVVPESVEGYEAGERVRVEDWRATR